MRTHTDTHMHTRTSIHTFPVFLICSSTTSDDSPVFTLTVFVLTSMSVLSTPEARQLQPRQQGQKKTKTGSEAKVLRPAREKEQVLTQTHLAP